MARMLDILEQFLAYHGHHYLRLDGATKVEQRQVLMERFNQDTSIFVFILSTRSGGLGVNLTGADTVIFYDSDWNPTMDAQAQDRYDYVVFISADPVRRLGRVFFTVYSNKCQCCVDLKF